MRGDISRLNNIIIEFLDDLLKYNEEGVQLSLAKIVDELLRLLSSNKRMKNKKNYRFLCQLLLTIEALNHIGVINNIALISLLMLIYPLEVKNNQCVKSIILKLKEFKDPIFWENRLGLFNKICQPLRLPHFLETMKFCYRD